MEGSYLDWALADFSGYIAADELYDGPFCVLFVVDNRTFKRLLYQVLDYDPGHKDIEAFLRRLEKALRQRGLVLQGVTTDGSPLYPEPLQAVFGDVPHQICEFHILKELTQAILRAVAKVRKKLAERKPKVKRGRPSTPTAKRAVRQRQRLQQKIADLFEHRYLFVQHDLTLTQRRTLQWITRGLPQLRALRAIMGEVSPVPYEKPSQAASCRGLLTSLVSSNNLRIVSNAWRKAPLVSSLSGTKLNS